MMKRQQNNSYDINMSPAAKRRQIRGKRSAKEFDEFHYREDMSEYEILEAWEWENNRDWTQHLPSVTNVNIQEDHNQVRRISNRKPKSSAEMQNTNARSSQDQNARKKTVKRTKDDKQKPGKKDMIYRIYTVSVFAILVAIVVMNILPWFYLWPIIILILSGYLGIRAKYKKRLNAGAKLWAIILSVVNYMATYYLILLFMVMLSICGDNTSELSLSKDTFSVYISGIDTYGDIDESSRSDVNLISTINPSTGQLLLTTTPRDFYVEIPGVSQGQKDKLTHAGNYGIDTSMKTLENIYDETIDLYVRVNFSSVIDIIDAMGGVTVESELDFVTSKNAGTVINVYEGSNHFDGVEALAFVRERYAFTDGDAQRGRNQQALLKGMISKMVSPLILIDAHKVLFSVGENVETNMSIFQLQTYVKSILKGSLFSDIQSQEVTGTAGRANCYSYSGGTLYVTIPDENSINNAKNEIDEIRNGKIYFKWDD